MPSRRSFQSFRDLLLPFLWGGLLVWLWLSGQLSAYLHPTLQVPAAVAGIILLVLALFALRALFLSESPVHECCHHGNEEGLHGNDDVHVSHGRHSSLWLIPLIQTALLVLPLTLPFFGQGGHFTMTTVLNRGVAGDLESLPAARPAAATPVAVPVPETGLDARDTPSGPMRAQIIDLLDAVQMPSYREDFENKLIELTGQFVPLTAGNPKGDRFQAIRLFITCCAADAKPVGVTVQYPKTLKIPEMGWIRVTGIPTFPMEGGRRTAVLMATKVEECPAPEEPFVY